MEHGRHHGGGKTGAHCRQGIVEQNGVGLIGAVIAGKPDFIHAVVECDDSVLGHRAADIGDQALRCHREARVVNALIHMIEDFIADFVEIGKIVIVAGFAQGGQAFECGGDIANQFKLGKIDLIHFGRFKIDMDDLLAILLHKEGRLFNHVMTGIDYQVGAVDGAMEIIAVRQCGGADIFRMIAANDALAHLGVEKGDAGFIDKATQCIDDLFPVGAGADQQKRPLGVVDHFLGRVQGLGVAVGPADFIDLEKMGVPGLEGGDVLGQLQMHSTGAFLFGNAECLSDKARNGAGCDDLMGHFGDRLHHGDNVDDLKTPLLAHGDRFLAGDHQHRHGAQLGVGRGGDEIGGAGAEGGQADAGSTRQPAVSCCHETRPLFVACQDEFDFRVSKAFEKIEVFLAGHAENIFDIFIFEGTDQEVGGLDLIEACHGADPFGVVAVCFPLFI